MIIEQRDLKAILRLARDHYGLSDSFYCREGRVGPKDIHFCFGIFDSALFHHDHPHDIDKYFSHAVGALYEATVLIDKQRVPANDYLLSGTHLKGNETLIDLSGFIYARECATALKVRLGYANWSYDKITDPSHRYVKAFEVEITIRDFEYLCQTEKGRIKAGELWDKYVPNFVPRPTFLDKDPTQATGPPGNKQEDRQVSGNSNADLQKNAPPQKKNRRKGRHHP